MSSTIGDIVRVTVFGQSHSEAIGCVIEGLPAGIEVDLEELQAFLDRRGASQGHWCLTCCSFWLFYTGPRGGVAPHRRPGARRIGRDFCPASQMAIPVGHRSARRSRTPTRAARTTKAFAAFPVRGMLTTPRSFVMAITMTLLVEGTFPGDSQRRSASREELPSRLSSPALELRSSPTLPSLALRRPLTTL